MLWHQYKLFCLLLIKLLLFPICNFATTSSLTSLRFLCLMQNCKHVLYAVLLLPSLTGQHKCIWLGPFESANFIFLSLNSRLRYITITVTGFHSVKNIYNYSKKIWDKLWFLCEIVPYGIGPISFFQYFWASTENIFILALRLGTSLSF